MRRRRARMNPPPPDADQTVPAAPPEGAELADSADQYPERLQDLVRIIRSGDDERSAATQLGASYAASGEGLDVCLAELDETLRAIRGEDAGPALVRAVALAWADATQQHYNCLTCADPFTGLSSLQHAQAHLASLYNAAANGQLSDPDIASGQTLVVVQMPSVRERSQPAFAALENSLRAAAAAELIEELLPEVDQPAQLNAHRIAGVARRNTGLPHRLTVLSSELDARLALSPSGGRCAVWTESLPDSYLAASHLLDELAR